MHLIPRFLPVKKTSDLLLVMSNLYSLDHGSLIMSPKVLTLNISIEFNLFKYYFSNLYLHPHI